MIQTTRLTYSRDMDIRNIEALPRGTGCRFLKCIRSHEDGVFIAKSWHRNKPLLGLKDEVSIEFNGSDDVLSQMWVHSNTLEVLDDTERYRWCNACDDELNYLERE